MADEADIARLSRQIAELAARIDLLDGAKESHQATATEELCALDRFKNDLPLTAKHMAELLDCNVRTVRRIARPSGRSVPGGISWYQKQEVIRLWRNLEDDPGSGDTGAPLRAGRRTRSSTGGRAGGSSKRPSPATEGSVKSSVAEVEKRLRAGPSRGSTPSDEQS
jgi:hypothetical protein